MRDVSLSLFPGQVHGLVGENGAGKSTLIKVLAGLVRPDAGSIELEGRPVSFSGPLDAESAGIAVVHQEPTDFPDLDVVDNLMLGHEPTLLGGAFIDRRRCLTEARQRLEAAGANVPFNVPVGRLSLAQRQLVAITRALAADCRLLILDEPTASLSPAEAGRLHTAVRSLSERGVAVLFVSHRLDEVLDLCGPVTVLKDGQHVVSLPASELDHDALVRHMVGRDLADSPSGRRNATGAPLLSVKGLTRRPSVTDVSFEVRSGEVVGLGGLVGAGRTEVARILAGIDRPDSGTVWLNGKALAFGDPRASIRDGLALVPEDRQHEGLVLFNSVEQNLNDSLRARRPLAGLLHRRQERASAQERLNVQGIKASGPDAQVASLSGGNQQKVVFGKWLALKPRVMILDEPTRGVDVGAKEEIYRLLHQFTDEGMAVLLISSDLPELLRLSDRILVMRNGGVTGELAREEFSEEAVIRLATGGGP